MAQHKFTAALAFTRRLTPRGWLVVSICLLIAALIGWQLYGSISDGLESRRQTLRDTQHNDNVNAALTAADTNQQNATAHEADRRASEQRYQASQRAVGRARDTAAAARTADEEATRRHEETRHTSTTDLPAVSDADVCAELKSINVVVDGCREE